MTIQQELTGHTSPETAYVVADYPYGFTLRTEIRYWVETKKGHGQRLVSQTRNPKKAGNPWNKPKAGIYSPIIAMYLDGETGYVEHMNVSTYGGEEKIEAFKANFPQTSADERNAKVLNYLIASARAESRMTWTVVPAGESRQTPQEQAQIIHKLTALELHKMGNA